MNLFEDLGNLSQLHVGDMINILKQRTYDRKDSTSITAVRNKFYGNDVGPNSAIINVGVIKNGLTDLKKAYKKYDTEVSYVVQAFAIYINNIAVAFGKYTEYDLAGSTRSGILAYDFNAFRDEIKSTKDRVPNRDRHQVDNKDNDFDLQSNHERSERSYSGSYSYADSTIEVKKYAGTVTTTRNLGDIFKIIDKIAKLTNSEITAKLVLADIESQTKSRNRQLSQNDINKGFKDLETRLKEYKLTKKPTVDTIEKFIEYALNNPGKIVTFAGISYKLTKQSIITLNPVSLINGATFDIYYSAENPGVYSSLTITYYYDTELMTLKPVVARWTDTISNSYQEAVLDPVGYIKSTLSIKKMDKDTIMRRILGIIKDNNVVKANKIVSSLEKMNLDWPELKILRNSIDHEIAIKTNGNKND